LRAIVGFIIGLATISYPLGVYYGLAHGAVRLSAFLLLASLLVNAASNWLRPRLGQTRQPRPGGLPRPRWLAWTTSLGLGLLLCVSLLLDDQRYLLAAPVLINAGLFSLFFGSLWGELPLVERLARLQVGDLSREEVAYCRAVTRAWSAFFVLNGATSALLACVAPLSWWALYTGLLAYLLVGAFGATEFTLRKYRFRRYGSGLLDRCYRTVFPPRSAGP